MGAAEGLFLGVALPAEVGVFVGTHVLGQVAGLTEVLPAPRVLAGEGTLARVDSDVLDEVGGLCVGGGMEEGREGEVVSECGWMVNLYSVEGLALYAQEACGLSFTCLVLIHTPRPPFPHVIPLSPPSLPPSKPHQTKRPTLVKALPQPSYLHLYRRGSWLPLVLVLVLVMSMVIVGMKETGMGSLRSEGGGESGRTTRR